jgi:hypothetical protein
MPAKARGHQGRADQDVTRLTQLQDKGLGLLVPGQLGRQLLCGGLALLAAPPVRRRGNFPGPAGADVPLYRPGPVPDPLASIVIKPTAS